VVNPVNDPPVISALTNQTTAIATPVGPIPFSIGDLETPVGNLTLAADSSNPALIPTDHIVFGGAGANRTLTLTPLPGETGNATITVTVNDGTVTTTNTFVLAVQLLPPGTVVFANPSPINIPSVGMASPYPSVITVDGVVGNISCVTVTLKHITHSWLSDVDMLLVGPNGQSAMIFSDVGTGQTVNNLTVMLADAAPVPLAETGAITTGVFKPTNNPGEPVDLGDPFVAPAPLGPYASPLAVFNGQTANGQWSLYAVDDGPGDQGMIADGWTLMITTVSSPTITTIMRVANGSIRFVGTGQPQVTYSIQASPDLAQWQPIGTATANTGGQFEFEDTAPLPSESRFYRVAFP
jgi:subtilisin-like proprotein convertase family protein